MRRAEFDSKSSIKPFLIVFLILIILITSTQVQGQNSIESGWEIVNSDVEKDIVNVIATEGEKVWAFGKNGLIMNSNDKGITWSINNQITNENLTSSDYLNGNLVVVGDKGKVIQLTADNGWKDISIPGILTNLKGVAISSEDSIFVITNNSTLWNYDGISWDEEKFDISNEFNSISFVDSNNGLNGIIVGDSGLILTTIDGGDNWELIEIPEELKDSNINSIDLFSSSKAYAITDSGDILISRNLETSIGFDWDLVNADRITDSEINFIKIKAINPLKVIITGTNYVATSKDGGNTFEEHNLSLISNGMTDIINDLTFIDGYCGVAVGNRGLILLTAQNEYGCTEGLDQSVGFEIEEFNNFGTFVEKYAPWMLDGLIATMKIVGFGILFGFLIGITLAMCKTAPTSLKDMIESHLERVIFFSWLIIPFSVLISRHYGNLIFAPITIIISLALIKFIEIYTKNKINKELNDKEGLFGLIIPDNNRLFLTRSLGLFLIIGIPEFVGFEVKGGLVMIINSIKSFRSLDINGIEYIFSPVGDPIGFSYLLFGIGILIPGILLLSSNG
ncbi:MAG: YCF48-related protein, partial [Candidatus Thalassarchaeaceae archaeon]|nr:YCF48-related protein [Candidatus Thalassarchaeaceae archaeon]